MADTTTVEKYLKTDNPKSAVEAIQQNHLANGAKSSKLDEDASNWILTTVWSGDC